MYEFPLSNKIWLIFQNSVLRKPPEDNLPSDEYASNHTRNGTIKKSSNITATTSNARYCKISTSSIFLCQIPIK